METTRSETVTTSHERNGHNGTKRKGLMGKNGQKIGANPDKTDPTHKPDPPPPL